MRPFFALLKMLLKQALRLGPAGSGGGSRRTALVLLALATAGSPLVLGLYAVFNQVYTLLAPAGEQAAVLTMAVVGGQSIVLLFGLYYLLSAFYYAGDLPLLLPLPLRPRDIVGAKLALVLAGEYLTVSALVVPIFLVYGVRGAGGWWYWPLALAVFLVLPVLPLAVSAVIIFPLMRFTAGSKNRELFRVVGSLLAVAVYLAVRFSVLSPREAPGRVGPWLRIGHTLSGLSWAAFLPQAWAADALAATAPVRALAYFLLFAAVSVFLLVLALVLAGKWFFRGAAGGYGAGLGRGGREKILGRGVFGSRSPLAALVFKETRVFFRTPVFVMNGLISTFIFPVMYFIGSRNRGWGYAGPGAWFTTVLVAAGVIVFAAGFGPVSATAVSREGKMLWVSKHLPLSGREQMTAKLVLALLFPLAAAVVVALALVLAAGAPVRDAFQALLLGLAGAWPAAQAGLIIDLLHPNLDWSDPQRAIKGFNGLLALVATVVLLGAAAAGAGLLAVLGVGAVGLLAFLFLFFLLSGLVLFHALGRPAERRYPVLEA